MHWIKEVEIAIAIDELMTSRSIVGRTDVLAFDMLDAMIASALKASHACALPENVSVEEQRAEKNDRFLRGKQIAYMMYEHFRATGAYEAVQGRSDLFQKRLQNDDGILCIFGSRTFLPISGMCKKQTSVSHSSTESEIILLDAGSRMDGILALDLWDVVLKCYVHQTIPKHQPVGQQETVSRTQTKRDTEMLVN